VADLGLRLPGLAKRALDRRHRLSRAKADRLVENDPAVEHHQAMRVRRETTERWTWLCTSLHSPALTQRESWRWRQRRASNGEFLGWVERTGNKLPDPVFIFLWLIGALIVISVFAALLGSSAIHPAEVDEETGAPVIISAVSLLSPENIRRLWVEMPETFTHFHPLGYVLVVMLGAGVAERAGLFGTAMRAGVRARRRLLLTPVVALVAMMGNLAADAAYVVLIPLAAVIFAAAGAIRSPASPRPLRACPAAFRPTSSRASSMRCCSASPRRRSKAVFGDWHREHRRQLVFHRRDDLRVPAGHLVRHRPDHRAAAGPLRADPGRGGAGHPGEEVADESADTPLTAKERKGLRTRAWPAVRHRAVDCSSRSGPGTPLIDEDAPFPASA
jgi:aminobenzoyl-glutamate transport protein